MSGSMLYRVLLFQSLPLKRVAAWSNQLTGIQPLLKHNRVTNKKRRFKGMLAVVGQSPPKQH